MLKPTLMVVSILVILGSLTSPASAASRVVAQASNKVPQGSVYLSGNLKAGHSYRIDVTAQGHQPFHGIGFQYLVYVENGRLNSDNKPIQLAGTTPHSFSVKQPVSKGVSQWALTVNVQLTSGRGLNVRFVDMGRAK